MTTWIRGCVCALALAVGLWAARAQAGMSLQEEWLAQFSRERARVGALPLRSSPVLTQAAQQQAEEMARRGPRPPSGEAVSERLRQVGYSAHDWREYFSLSDTLLDAVLATLRAEMDGRFRDLGVGTAVVDGFTFCVYLLSAAAVAGVEAVAASEGLKVSAGGRCRSTTEPSVTGHGP